MEQRSQLPRNGRAAPPEPEARRVRVLNDGTVLRRSGSDQQRGARSLAPARRAPGRGTRPTYVVRGLDAHDFRVVDLDHSIIAYDAAAALRAAADWIAFVLDLPDGSFDVRLESPPEDPHTAA